MIRKIWRIAALGALCAVIVACGSSSSSKPSGNGSGGSTASKPSGSAAGAGKTVSVCKIITADDAAKVFGGVAKEEAPAGSELSTKGVCLYKKDTTDIAVNLLQVRVYGGPQFYGASIFPDHKTIDVTGASKAFLSVKKAPGGTAQTFDIQFVKGGQTGAVNYVATKGADEATVVPALKAIANKLAAKI